MPNKTVLLHCHIFKNGGTTIDDILIRNFGLAAVKHESGDGHFLSSEDINRTIQEREVSSVSSHKLGLPVPSHGKITFIPLIMIREPLDRLGSMYSFYNRQKKNNNHECILAKQNSFKGFVEILINSGVDSSFVNLQSQFLMGNYLPPKCPSSKNWEILTVNLESACVGLLERFDDSMVLWEDCLSKYFPMINFAYSKANVSYNRAHNLSERLDKIKDELGEQLIAEFEKRNHFDYRLYRIVQKRIDREVRCLPEFDLKKEKFLQKNIELSANVDAPTYLVELKSDESKTAKDLEESCCINAGKYQLSRIPSELDQISSSSICIIGCGLFDGISRESIFVVRHDMKVEVIVAVKAKESISQPIVGITVKNNINDIMFSMNSFCKDKIPVPKIGKVCLYSFIFKIPSLNSGTYSITPAFASGTQENHVPLSCVEDALVFVVPKMIPQRLPGALYVEKFQINELQD